MSIPSIPVENLHQDIKLILSGVVAGGFAVIILACVKLYRHRSFVRSLSRKGLPVAPEHNFVLGHLLYLKKFSDRLPKDAHFQYMFSDIYLEKFQDGGVFYLDMWPLSPLFQAIISPTAATSATQTNRKLATKKPDLLPKLFKPLAGGRNLLEMPETEWKKWRILFNKGFSADNFLELIPGIIKQSQTYVDILRDHAEKKDVFALDHTTIRLTMDLIGKTILNSELGTQRGYNVLADCMINQMRWQRPAGDMNPLNLVHFPRWFMQWWNGRQMDQFVGAEIDQRYEDLKNKYRNTKSKAIIDLVLETYLQDTNSVQLDKLDPEFRRFAVIQIRMFVFAGHYALSSALCYCVYLLSKYKDILRQVRDEHDAVYGKDISLVSSKLASEPQLSNDLPYTTAVLKEAMRLFPPASSSRQGSSGVDIIDDKGTICPTEGAVVWVNHAMLHRAPKYWVKPNEFLPQRWLVEPGHELYPLKGAFRPFENGPRNCIAQGLPMVKLRVVLSLILRQFDFQDAYEEADTHSKRGLKTYRGERAYQIDSGAAHPADFFPCKVSIRVQNK